MKSIFEKVDKILDAHDDENLDDLMAELESAEPTLGERLEAIGYTRGEALAAARSETAKRADLAKKVGINNLSLPYAWIELVDLCGEKNEPSRDKLELALWLMANGKLTETTGLSDDEMISDWLCKTEKVKEYTEYLTEFTRAGDELVDIILLLEKSKIKYNGKPNPADGSRVFNLLCDEGFADECKNKEILRGNLETLGAFIAEIPELEPIKPLIYFQAYVRYNKKLFNKPDFAINPKKILDYHEYKIDADNGKNYKQNALYCALYSELKNCFPNADKSLCDTGFMACSNLAEWWYKIEFEGYSRDEKINIPVTPQAYIREQCVTCFEGSAVGKTMNVSAEQLIKWRKANPSIIANAEKAAADIEWSDLKAFADNSVEFCGKLFAEKKIGGIKPADHATAWALFIKAVEERFDELLEEQLTEILLRYGVIL
ncbi:MAG: hypothetical protein NC299_04060 [Lachnospiraceae bacterium]|nr:hypothetical protein [Ruminococcus sp.]MCM1274522.1 hypothetical protein [Lachnospiraceae bacterium]